MTTGLVNTHTEPSFANLDSYYLNLAPYRGDQVLYSVGVFHFLLPTELVVILKQFSVKN